MDTGATLSRLRCRCGTLCSVCAYVLTMLGVAWAVLGGAETMGYNWQWYRVPRFIVLPDGSPGPLLQGAGVTLLVS
ncbi:MAG TPA: polar amino acid ABC transporter permease, partial [Elusimicrobia bacterium]|nr:polar amino acid ABC transporter permease [Elusimicrobiota bacterium]